MASSVASNGSPTLRRTINRSQENAGLADDAVDRMTARMVSFPSHHTLSHPLFMAISVPIQAALQLFIYNLHRQPFLAEYPAGTL